MKKIILICLLFITVNANAATYYISPSGSDSANGTSTETAWSTFSHAFTIMAGGDTLILSNGTYTQQLSGMPSGSSSAYTIIKAENTGSVVIQYSFNISNRSYIKIEGIKINGNLTQVPGTIYSSNHIKIMRCAFYGAPESGNIEVAGCTLSSYILWEECWAWGGGRYKFLAYQSDHVVYRRCVSRHDYHNPAESWGQQCACFTVYDTTDFLLQNCIGIDSGQTDRATGTLYGAVWSENNADVTNSGKIIGCIFLNIRGLGAINDPKQSSCARVIQDTVVWDTEGGILVRVQAGSPTTLLNRCTIGNITGRISDESFAWSSGAIAGDYWAHYPVGNAVINNSIVYHSDIYGISEWFTSNYNDVNSCGTANWGGRWQAAVPGANDLTVSPLSNGLMYLNRIEDGSTLKTAGQSGGQIGAQIVYRYGTDESLWGEPEYDTLTGNNLWPFPNEDAIKTDMSSYNSHGVDGARGFCATGETLTHYIMNYLGNGDPYTVDTTAPASVTNLSAQIGSNSGEVALSWTAPGDDGVDGTATSYDVRYSTSTINEGNWTISTAVTGEPTPSVAGSTETLTISNLSPGTTYYFAMKTTDEQSNTSDISNSSQAQAATVPPQFRGISWTGIAINL